MPKNSADFETMKLIQNVAGLGIWEWDLVTDKVEWSPELEKLHGKPLGDSFDDFKKDIHPDDLGSVMKSIIMSLKKRKWFVVEYRILLSNGEVRWLLSRARIYRDKLGVAQRVVGVSRDISYRKDMERRLSVQYKIATTLAESTSIAQASGKVLSALSVSLGLEIGILWLNRDGTDSLKVAGSWCLEKYSKYVEDSDKGDFNINEGILGEVFRKPKSIWISNVNRHKSHKRANLATKLGVKSAYFVPVRIGSKVFGVLEFGKVNGELDRGARLIVESVGYQLSLFLKRIRAEEDTKETMRQLMAVFQSVPEGLTVENEEGELVYANDSVGKILGIVGGLEKKKNIRELLIDYLIFSSEDKELQIKDLPASKTFITGGFSSGIFNFKNRYTDDNVWLQISATPVLDESAKPYLVVKVFRDISDEVEEQRQREMYIGLVGHEIKNPLASLKAYLQLLLRRLDKGRYEEARELVDSVDKQSDRLNKLINDMLDATRIRANKLQLVKRKVDVGELVSQVVQEQKMISKEHVFTVSGAKHIEITIDPDRIQQVITNLLNNAVNYSKQGSKIMVSIKENDNNVSISVRDFGIGISKKHQREIFKLYKRLEEEAVKKYPGLGMGLFISTGIVREHGGKLKLRSEKGKGSTFTIVLPKV